MKRLSFGRKEASFDYPAAKYMRIVENMSSFHSTSLIGRHMNMQPLVTSKSIGLLHFPLSEANQFAEEVRCLVVGFFELETCLMNQCAVSFHVMTCTFPPGPIFFVWCMVNI